MGIPSSQPVAAGLDEQAPGSAGALPADLVAELWQRSEAAACDLSRVEFTELLLAALRNWKQSSPEPPASAQRADYLRSLKLADLALAGACARGKERAWERFLALYRQPLTRAAIAIAGSETVGRELAGSLYAELYGLKSAGDQRRCPLNSYHGRGSLLGWLRATLAQRHVDRHRRAWREEPLPDPATERDLPAPAAERETPPAELGLLAAALCEVFLERAPDDRFLLAAYYLDQRTLLQIARVLGVHEATVSRKLRRAVEDMRKSLLRSLEKKGMSKRAALEALDTDPRDLTGVSGLDLNLGKLLQYSQSGAFPEKAGP